jgi:hypothetical protein
LLDKLFLYRTSCKLMSLQAAALALPWHRPPGQVWRRGNLRALKEIAHLHCTKRSAVQVSDKNKNALAMTGNCGG